MEGREIIKWSLSALAVIIIVGYSYFVLDDFVRGPRIIIDTPKSGFSTTTPVIVISGRAPHTNNLAINDYQTAVDLEGNFRGQLILATGYNIIKITGKDAYARTVEKKIEINLISERGALATSTVATSTPSVDISPIIRETKLLIPQKNISGCSPGQNFSTTTGKKCTRTTIETSGVFNN